MFKIVPSLIKRSVLVLIAVAIALLTSLPGVALAQAPVAQVDDRASYLAEASVKGTLTDEERQEFIRDYYDLAAITPDGSRRTFAEAIVETESVTAAAGGCKTVSGTHRATSTVGFTLVR